MLRALITNRSLPSKQRKPKSKHTNQRPSVSLSRCAEEAQKVWDREKVLIAFLQSLGGGTKLKQFAAAIRVERRDGGLLLSKPCFAVSSD
jgi:hypothetical protein